MVKKMVRKIIGIAFLAVSVLAIIGSVINGSLFEDKASAVATYGAFLGFCVIIVLYILSGVFMLSFDRVCKMSFVDGYKERKKQTSKITVFMVVYIVVMILTEVGYVVAFTEGDLAEFLMGLVFRSMPIFIPFIIFTYMFSLYTIPFSSCDKNFRFDDNSLNYYISSNEKFVTYSEDNSVYASDKTLFFPKSFCIIPFDRIASVRLVNLVVEKDVEFVLSSGKKLTIMVTKKQYEAIEKSINANK